MKTPEEEAQLVLTAYGFDEPPPGIKRVLINAFTDRDAEVRQKVLEVASDLRAWSDGVLGPVTGMGAGLHAEMWPHIGPAGARLLRELAERLEGKS